MIVEVGRLKDEVCQAQGRVGEAMAKRKEAEVDNLKVAQESFVNAIDQLRILNPGLNTASANHLHLIENGAICHIVGGEIVPL